MTQSEGPAVSPPPAPRSTTDTPHGEPRHADSTPNRVLGMDGKTYPSRQLHRKGRDYLVGRAHWLAHADGLSIRQIMAVIAEETGVQRSVGAIHSWLRWQCDHCSGAQNSPPEQLPAGSAA